MHTLKTALRTLARSPFVSAVAVMSLALGIGANAAIFSLLDRMLLRALPVQEPGELVNLGAPGPKPGSTSCGQSGDCDQVFSYPMFRDLQERQTSLEGIAAHVFFSANLAYANQTVNGSGALVSGSYFPLLGVRPVLGRLLTPGDDQTVGGHFVAVLSHRYWSNRLGADPSVLNKTIVVNGHPLTVIGVAARGFDGTTLGRSPDVFVPITMRGEMQRGWDGFDDRQAYWAYLFGRLRPDRTIEVARAELNTLYQGIINDVEVPLQSMSEQTLRRFREKPLVVSHGGRGQSSMHEEVDTPLKLLFGITGLVLLIACANIANLLLAQGAARRQEIAIRGSLGASRRRLFGQLVADAVVLALLGGGVSLLVARWTLQGIMSILPPETSTMITAGISPSMVAFTAALSIGTGLVFGLYPAIHLTQTDLMTAIRAGSGQASGARAATRFRNILVTTQMALSMALLVAAGLFVKSLRQVSRVDLGLETDNTVTFALSPQLNGYEPERSQALFERVTEELAALPGVTAVSGAMVPVLTGNSWGSSVAVEGFEGGPDVDNGSRYNEIGPEYLSTLGIPLLAGREFVDGDASGTPRVAIINEVFARKFGLDPREAVGKLMGAHGDESELDTEIVGVIGDTKYSHVKQETPPLFLLPYRQNPSLGWLTFYVRSSVAPEQVLRAVPDVVKRLDPNLPVEDLMTVEAQIKANIVLDRVIAMLSAAFAGLATLLAGVGLYGMLAFTVTQRTREIGLRMALGADGRRVRGMILRQVGRIVLIGGAVGVVAALGLGRAAQSLLFGLDGHDPMVIGVVALVLGGVALSAGYAPALRASRVDPMRALRYE